MTSGYCSKCGEKIGNSNARFCIKCGAYLTQSNLTSVTENKVSPPPTLSSVEGERVMAAVPVSLKESVVFQKPYILLITTEKIILVKKTKELYERIVRQAEANAKASGKGFFGRMKEKLVQTARMYERFFDMSPEVILAENPESLLLPNNSISGIKYRKSRYIEDNSGDMKLENGIIVISSAGHKYKLTLEAISEERDLKELLTDIFGKRVKSGFIIG